MTTDPRLNRQNEGCTRRSFIQMAGSTVMAAAPLCMAAASTPATAADAPAASGSLPKGKLGNVEISRLILGTNIITHHVHARDLQFVRNLDRRYNSDERVMETFAQAQKFGVNTFMTHHDPNVVRLFKEFRDKHNGKMKWVVAPDPKESRDVEEFSGVVQRLVDHGVDALYLHGATSDPLFAKGKMSLLGKFVEIMKATGLPSGVGAHDLEVVKACEAAKVPADFYVKTFHHHKYPTAPQPQDIIKPIAETPHGYWCAKPEETAEFMKSVKQPWIAFKVMAAGAIPPKDAFKYAFANGADFILAGMFDFEIADDVQYANEVLAGLGNRPRSWRA